MSSTENGAVAPSGAPSKTSGPLLDSQMLVYHISFIILGLIALLFILRIPRILAHLSRFSEWSQGSIFRNIPYAPRITPLMHGAKASMSSIAVSSDDSHTYVQHTPPIKEKGQLPTTCPPHVACPAFLRGLQSKLSIRVLPGFSLAQAICLNTYAFGWIFAIYYMSNPFSDLTRPAWVGVAQLPFIFAFATKNNILGAFLGLGYEKVNFMHRIAGFIMVMGINLHAIGFMYTWFIKDVFVEKIAQPSHLWGQVGLIALNICYFLSAEGWRQRAYRVFIASHVIGFSVLLAAIWMHQPAARPLVISAIALYSFDALCRCIKTRIHTATLRPIPELGMTRVEIPQINAGWRAGQHVRLRVLSSGMGVLGWAETHPFTIASASNSPEGMVLMVKKVGGWTGSLFDMANSQGSFEGGVGRNSKVMVEGPYGGPGLTISASNSAAVFVAGGSGITYAMSGINDLIQKDLKGKSRVKTIELVWVVQDPVALVALVPQFSAMIEQSVLSLLCISVFYTRAIVGKFPFAEDFFHPGLSLSPGRPKILNILEDTISKALTSDRRDGHKGMIVAVCGPTALADNVVRAVGMIDSKRKDEIGGVEIIEEVFGW